jgi:DNA-binding transcriptional regulator GbsR (MarR family)
MNENPTAEEVRMRLVELGGRSAQDFGFGRLLGQVLVHLYLSENEQSLDQIELKLGLSKAAVSESTRQLEAMGFLVRVTKLGDRRNYYRTGDNLGQMFQEGLLMMLRRKISSVESELEQARGMAQSEEEKSGEEDIKFLVSRIKRAEELNTRARRLLGSRIFRLLVG